MNPGSQLLIHINGQPLHIERGLTILEAARQNGIDIPTLCDYPGLPSPGSCRMCIVEIQGRQHAPTSCTTPVEEGMTIFTHSPKVQSLRVELLQMLLAEHPSGCLFCPEKDRCSECMVTLRKAGVTTGCGSCPKDNQCELQSLAEKLGVENPGYPVRYRMLPVKKHDPFFDRDDNLCILCGRCIRVCESLHFTNTLAYTRRGTQTLVSTAFNRTHLEANCTFCGSCVEVCPTGALTEKTRKWGGKPDHETATSCPFCSIGCQINILTKQEHLLGSLPNHSAGTHVLCVKGRFGITELVNHPTRLKQPQKSADNFRQSIGWEEAVRTAAEKLAACPPERFELRISASCTSEDLYVAHKFARDVMKTRNIRTSTLDHYGTGLDSVSRLLQASLPLEMIEDAPAVLCLGLEDSYAHSVVEVHLHRAKNKGVKIIHLGSRKLNWSAYADEWLHSEQGQEMVLIQKLVELTVPELHARQHVGLAAQADSSGVARAARLLQQSNSPMIILGPAVLTYPDNQVLLQSVEMLIHNLGARVTTLLESCNLAGALRLGLYADGPAPAVQDLDVLYLIGEALPALPSDHTVILYQNLFPPAGDALVDLLLPTTAFAEENGTYIDYAGRVQAVHPAVPPPGEALPSWLILSRIARQMGAQGFAFTCVEDIWQAAQSEFPGFPDVPLHNDLGLWSDPRNTAAHTGSTLQTETNRMCSYSYMGFPLSQWVEGLRSLEPEKTIGSDNEPNS